MTNLRLPTHDETNGLVRLAQRLPTWVYGSLIGVAFVTGALTLPMSNHPIVGSISAISSALAAAGFVLHDRPRRLSKRWADLSWDPVIAELADQGLLDYESTASAVWVIRESEHRKGRFPIVRLAERTAPSAPWSEFFANAVISPHGDITVTVDVSRSNVEDNCEVLVLIS